MEKYSSIYPSVGDEGRSSKRYTDTKLERLKYPTRQLTTGKGNLQEKKVFSSGQNALVIYTAA
jgi:hypothetical protein